MSTKSISSVKEWINKRNENTLNCCLLGQLHIFAKMLTTRFYNVTIDM